MSHLDLVVPPSCKRFRHPRTGKRAATFPVTKQLLFHRCVVSLRHRRRHKKGQNHRCGQGSDFKIREQEKERGEGSPDEILHSWSHLKASSFIAAAMPWSPGVTAFYVFESIAPDPVLPG
jgi:hypothetical protein